jgi:hypothetical protein
MTHHRVTLAVVVTFLFVVPGQWPGRAVAQVDVNVGGIHVQVGGRPAPPAEEVVVLTRGPIHEAFAQPVTFDEATGFRIGRRPPAAIDEIPPDQRPDGNHIVWIPGYWNWDSDRDGFIWVSGCWRAVPPGTSWVPGYWAEVGGGYQWTAGFWTAADVDEIEYLPAPPTTLEEGPQQTRGSADSVWIPGCWVRRQNRYAWRAGFWQEARPNWVWVPAQYVATPRGWIYVDGYWDYPLDRRGVAFLPVYCPPSLYGRTDFRYSPDIALDLGGLMLNLFISPRRHQYYFGDYYGSEYLREGYYPWFEAPQHRGWYDPIFVQQQWQHRDDRRWIENQRAGYDRRLNDRSLRPARTYEAMRTQEARLPERDRGQVQMARPMKEVVSAKNAPFKFNTVDAKTREAAASQARDVHAYKDKRSQWESPASPRPGPEPKMLVTPKDPPRAPPVAIREPVRTTPRELPRQPAREVAPPERPRTPNEGAVPMRQPAGPDVQPQRVKIPKSPISVREPSRDRDLTPPPRPNHPDPDPDARPGHAKDAPDRTKGNDGSDKDKPESKKK